MTEHKGNFLTSKAITCVPCLVTISLLEEDHVAERLTISPEEDVNDSSKLSQAPVIIVKPKANTFHSPVFDFGPNVECFLLLCHLVTFEDLFIWFDGTELHFYPSRS